MLSFLKRNLAVVLFTLFVGIGCVYPLNNSVEADAPRYEQDFASQLKDDNRVLNPSKFGVKSNQNLRQNIVSLFYPSEQGANNIYYVIRDISLGVMIIFIIRAGASLLLGGKTEESKKRLTSLLYIMLGGVFIYAANRLFGSVLKFNGDQFTLGTAEEQGIGGFTNALIGNGGVFFVVLSAVKAFAFFLAIIMIVVTGFRVMAAGEGEKGGKLLKGVINVVVALLIIKGVDFIYYLAADSGTFVKNASDFIINVAKVFGYIYGVIIVIMVIVAGYLYITDGGSGNNFKKASNILVNILLSALVLFAFLLITYQIFAEFQTGGDAVESTTAEAIASTTS